MDLDQSSIDCIIKETKNFKIPKGTQKLFNESENQNQNQLWSDNKIKQEQITLLNNMLEKESLKYTMKDQEYEKLNLEKNDMQKKYEDESLKMAGITSKYNALLEENSKLVNLNQYLQKEKEELKARHSKEMEQKDQIKKEIIAEKDRLIEELKEYHKKEIEKEDQFRKDQYNQNEKYIKDFKEQHQESIKEIHSFHDKEIATLKEVHKKEIEFNVSESKQKFLESQLSSQIMKPSYEIENQIKQTILNDIKNILSTYMMNVNSLKMPGNFDQLVHMKGPKEMIMSLLSGYSRLVKKDYDLSAISLEIFKFE